MQKESVMNWGKYHELYLKSNTVLLADVLENFRKISLEKLLTVAKLAWQEALKKT